MKMYESYEASRYHCNRYFESQDGALLSCFLPQGYYSDVNGVRPLDPIKGNLNGIESTAASKELIFKTEPDDGTEEWKEKQLRDWSSTDVLHWIASVAESQKFPYELVNASAFNVDGKTLLSLTKRQFLDLDEKYGCLLYRALRKCLPVLEEIPKPVQLNQVAEKSDLDAVKFENLTSSTNQIPDDLINLAGKNSREEAPPYGLVNGPDAYLTNPSECYPFELNPSLKEKTPPFERKEEKKNAYRRPCVPFESDECPEKNSRKGGAMGKRPPGRPPGVKAKKEKPEKKTGRLWEFIRDLLLDPQHCPSVICWENHEDGIFRFVKSEKVAKIWGDRKGNEKMNYEKLSRAMRYYYRSKVLQPVLGRRLVYKFGPTARGWKTENPNFRH